MAAWLYKEGKTHPLRDSCGLLAGYLRDRFLWMRARRDCRIKGKSFLLDSRSYRYFLHPYNQTWANERAVEIAVARDYLLRQDSGDVLEIGNVLSHYFRTNHAIVDKYEKGLGGKVTNQDFVGFDPGRKYKLIVSISTFEHIGWDETPRRPEKVLDAFDNIDRLLAPGGVAVVTIPVYGNKFLEESIREGRIRATKILCLQRVSRENDWVAVDLDTALSCSYGAPFEKANGLIILVIGKEPQA